MTTVHFIYTLGNGLSCPDAIVRQVGERLRHRYRVKAYHLLEPGVIRPGADDVLLGHPWFSPWTPFRRSANQKGWKRVIMMMPYVHGDPGMDAYLDPIVPRCDLFLAITGRYWFQTIGQSPFAHWGPKMIHVDLAVDRRDFPVVKKQFNPSGKRKFVYIGHAEWYKSPKYLSAIARAMPETEIAWIGDVGSLPGLHHLGRLNFSDPAARRLVSQYDFLLTVGYSDANPTTILEAMSWGLIPVCTPQSGYVGYPSIPNVPQDDVPGALKILRELQTMPETKLCEMQNANWRDLDTHYNWDRLSEQVISAIESNASPACGLERFSRKLYLRWAAAIGKRSWLRPNNLVHWGGRALIGPRKRPVELFPDSVASQSCQPSSRPTRG